MIRIGARKSILSVAQVNLVIEAIKQNFPEETAEFVPIVTKGDINLSAPLQSFEGKGAFTRELEDALLRGEIDMAVHSAKDMPVILPEGLTVGAVLRRADVRDVLVTLSGTPLERLQEGAVIGTGSLRRKLQLETAAAGVRVENIRGNVQTRLNKLSEAQYDGIILAAAGIKRLGYLPENAEAAGIFTDGTGQQFYYECLSAEVMLPAAGQAIIAVETRQGTLQSVLDRIDDKNTRLAFTAERAFLTAVGGSCNAPAAAWALTDDTGHFLFEGGYAADAQARMAHYLVRKRMTGDMASDLETAGAAGIRAAERLLAGKA